MFKKIIIGIVALVVVVIGALVAIPFFYSIDDLRPQIQTAAEQQVHGKVELGKLTLKLFPEVRIQADGIRVTPAAPYDKEPLAEIATVSIRMPLMSFLTGPKATFYVEKPKIVLISKGESSNLNTLLPPKAPEAAAAQPAQPAEPSKGVDEALSALPPWLGSRVRAARLSVEVKDGQAAIRDLAAPRKTDKTEVKDLDLSLTNINLSSPIGIKVSLSPEVVSGDTKVSGVMKTEGTVTATPEGKGFRVSLDVDQDLAGIDAKMGTLFHKKAGIPLNAGVKGTVVQGDTISADLKEIEFRFGGFKMKGSVNVTDATNPAKAGVKASLRSGDTTIGPFGAMIPMVADFKLDGKFGLALDASGPMNDPTVNVEVRLADITGATPNLKHPVSGLTGKIVVQGTAKAPSVTIDPFSLKIASSDLSLKVIAKAIGEKMSANVTVTSKRMNADELLGLQALHIDPLAKKEKVPPPTKAIPMDESLNQAAPSIEQQLANPMLDKVSATIVLDFKSIRALGAEFTNASFNMAYANRDLRITKTGIGGYGGRVDLSGAVGLDPKAVAFDIKAGLANVNLGTMTATHAPGWKNALTGTMNGEFAISGKGIRKEQLNEKLAGGLKGEIKNGTLALPIVRLVEAGINSIPKGLQSKAVSESKDKEYKGEFKKMKLVSVIKGRNIQLQDLDVDYDTMKAGLGEMRFQATGSVTFDQMVDVVGTAYLSPQIGNTLGVPKGPSGKSEIPLRFTGSMIDPKPDLAYTAKILVPRLAGNALKTKAVEQAKAQIQKLAPAVAPHLQKLEEKAPPAAKKQINDLKKKFGF